MKAVCWGTRSNFAKLKLKIKLEMIYRVGRSFSASKKFSGCPWKLKELLTMLLFTSEAARAGQDSKRVGVRIISVFGCFQPNRTGRF